MDLNGKTSASGTVTEFKSLKVMGPNFAMDLKIFKGKLSIELLNFATKRELPMRLKLRDLAVSWK